MLKQSLPVYFLSQNLFAAGGGGGHLSELLFPAVNFLILVTFLIIKGRKPLAELFERNAKDVKELYDVAEKKDKESQIRLEIYQKKIADFKAEQRKLQEETEKSIRLFQRKVDEETTKLSRKMNQEGLERIENEKKIILWVLSEQLVDEVVKVAKDNVMNDRSTQKRVTMRLVSQVE